MKKILLTTALILIFNSISAQERPALFKGLLRGMTKKEVRAEYKANKTEYTNVDIGDGWVYKTDVINTFYDQEKGLSGIYFFLNNSLLYGVGYKNTVNGLEMTRTFFESIGYTTFYENEFWNAPASYSSVYGLILVDKTKTKVAHLFPTKSVGLDSDYTPGLILFDYDIFMRGYKAVQEQRKETQKKTGFK